VFFPQALAQVARSAGDISNLLQAAIDGLLHNQSPNLSLVMLLQGQPSPE
jgi:hypothetical protein